MTGQNYDVIILGSGAGGSACAYNLVQAGKRVLLLEKGGHLPRDGSTLDVKPVFGEEHFKNRQPWTDNRNRKLTPGEYYNVGGKTKWYGAALLRFGPHEFNTDPDFQCPGWPISYADLEPFYAQAEQLLQINHFDNEPQLSRLINRITQADNGWRVESLPLGLKKNILDQPVEAKHFDGFASPGGYKADAEQNLLSHLFDNPLFQLLPYKEVAALLSNENNPAGITGVCSARWSVLLRRYSHSCRRRDVFATHPAKTSATKRTGQYAALGSAGGRTFQTAYQQRLARVLAVPATGCVA